MDLEVEVVSGTAFESLLTAGAISDPDWRDTFAAGRSIHAELTAQVGADLVSDVEEVGRLGWINLLGIPAKSPDARSLPGLITALRELGPARVHELMVGADRRQLRSRIDPRRIEAALGGDVDARKELSEAIASDDNVLHATPWLLESSSAAVHSLVMRTLTTWQEALLPTLHEKELAALLDGLADETRGRAAVAGNEATFGDVTRGVHYAPPELGHVTLVASPVVSPVLVVIDEASTTVIVHPPLSGLRDRVDAAVRLSELGRAVGDKTRIRLLQLLTEGPTTAVELATALSAPRTTLLHHLAILRSAGLIQLRVAAGSATVYWLLPQGFEELASASLGFIGRLGPELPDS